MERRLRILIVSLLYPPASTGGYEIMCAQVCEWLYRRGHDLLVLTTTLPAAHDTQEQVLHIQQEGHIPVRRALRCYWDGKECLYPPLLDALALEQANQKIFQETLDEYQPDVVSFWHMGDMSLSLITTAARKKLPNVFVIGDDWLCYGWWADGWIRRFKQHPQHAEAVERQTGIPTRLPDLGTMGVSCFVSDYTRRHAEQVGGWRFPRFAITPPGISWDVFPPLAQPIEQPWQWRLLWIGRGVEAKGIEVAIHALRLLPSIARMEIVGPVDPAYRRHLEEIATSAGVIERLSFSLATRKDVRLHYQRADVTLFTSTTEHEAFGLVPLEAMASGCPVISTGVGGSAEYCIDSVNCLRTLPGDAEDLAHAVQRLTAEPGLRQKLVRGGLHTASQLTLDCQAERIEHWLLHA